MKYIPRDWSIHNDTLRCHVNGGSKLFFLLMAARLQGCKANLQNVYYFCQVCNGWSQLETLKSEAAGNCKRLARS
ncbi:hypothetical protein C5167_042737 [Papaver somniferum]|uniref:Uncharacterized protein n=1 Tax=Papaver somniferum TaxID=3469 RepID=A0A4Y7L702_PAPSO|nr:hypothetical protein C5167_042737 [Papaver somniferum]